MPQRKASDRTTDSSLNQRLAPLASLKNDPDALKKAVLPIVKEWLGQQQLAIRQRFEDKGAPNLMLTSHSRIMDTLLGALYGVLTKGTPPHVALIAVGGYGRRELFPYSDLDLLFLNHADNDDESARIAEWILYVLWDLGLKVGQAHRSIDESIALAQSDISVRTTLLDARFIAGRKPLFNQFETRFQQEIVEGSIAGFIEAKLAERDTRHQRFGDSRYVLEPNVKEGKGGLRDLHTLWWIAHYIYRVHDLKELVGMHLLTEEEYRAFDQARQFLCRVRIHLHYLTGRMEDRLTFDRQHALAVAMGFNHPSANRSIERFMRRYFVAVRTVGSFTRIFCSLLEEDNKRQPRKSLAWMWFEPWMLGAFQLDNGRLNVRDDDLFKEDPVKMLEIFKISQSLEFDIHPRALQLMARSLSLLNSEFQRNEKANSLFMDILLSTKNPEITLRRMSEAGVLGRFIPDFGRVVGQTQFNMYHVYTVDEHTLVAIGILHAMEKGKLRDELPLASRLIHRIQMRRVLYLALFCHDIAKGRGGDHSELGEKIAEKLAIRFGFSPDETETAAWLVRYHLLFSNTAFKRDIDEPKTVQDFVRMVQSPERLKLLLVLTAADIRAVGPAVWNAWKGSLLRDLYARAEQSMGIGSNAGGIGMTETQLRRFKHELGSLLPGWKPDDMERYLELGNLSSLASIDPARHAIIARMLKEFDFGNAQTAQDGLPLLLHTEHDKNRSITEIIVCAQDQLALFSIIAGAISLAGANIITAKVLTLKNNIAIDIFHVQNSAGEVFDRPEKLAKLSVYLEQALRGELDLATAFAKRRSDYGNPSHDALPVPGQVFIENDASNICSVIELTGRDRSGFLHDVTKTLAGLGLSIVTAHITTYGTQVADVFYVKDIFGMKITHSAKIKQVRTALLQVVNKA